MPKIVINELDKTTPFAEQLSEDIVFIPGFANVNGNVYIGEAKESEPKANTVGTKYNDGDTVDTANANPSIYSNPITLQSWTCKDVNGSESNGYTYTWEQSATYFAPHPENEVVVCYTTDDFTKNFGAEPAKFSVDQDISANCTNATAFEKATAFRKNGDIDLSYTIAMECLVLGLPVAYVNVTNRQNGVPYTAKSVTDLYNKLPSLLTDISDPDYVYVRYITSGAYPTFEMKTSDGKSTALDTAMIDAATARKDAYALIDHGDSTDRVLFGDGSVIKAARTAYANIENGSRGAMFTPWGTYNITNLKDGGGVQSLPASFAYLTCLATSIRSGNPAYLAIANVGRGKPLFLQHLNTTSRLSSAIANTEMQSETQISINPITNINPYGLVIYGNNTLSDNSKTKGKTATSDLNIRNLACRVTKLLRDAAQQMIFEPNTDALWVTFKGRVMPSLDAMVSGQGLKRYNIVRVESSNQREVKAKVYLFPVYSVEKVTIDLILSDEGITVEGE